MKVRVRNGGVLATRRTMCGMINTRARRWDKASQPVAAVIVVAVIAYGTLVAIQEARWRTHLDAADNAFDDRRFAGAHAGI
jgi:hypothetical protein